MKNQKLINILLKDMGELEELISEIKAKKEFDILEMEFLHTRSKGILQLMQMLKNVEPEVETPLEFNKEEKNQVEDPVETNAVSEKTVAEELNIPAGEKKSEISGIEAIQTEEVKTEIKETPVEPAVVKVEEKTDTVRHETEDSLGLPENSIKISDVELEENKAEAGHRLGDSFIKGKSVNDMVEDHNKLEFKLSNRPVSNIQAAIGINDRFQYIRELFDGSSEKYTNTVVSLDSMNNINEAVAYIQKNFKWKKNETSLKFINLVKRRFANE